MTAAGLLVVFLLLFIQPAPAQGPCDLRESVVRLLSKKYQEAPVASGITNQGSLVEVLTDARGGTWTIIITSPQGMSCLVFSGESWRGLQQVAREPEA